MLLESRTFATQLRHANAPRNYITYLGMGCTVRVLRVQTNTSLTIVQGDRVDPEETGAGSAYGLMIQENISMCVTHQLTQGLENAHRKQGKGAPEQFLHLLDRAVAERDAIGVQLSLVAGRLVANG
jgi:hypothetical protein